MGVYAQFVQLMPKNLQINIDPKSPADEDFNPRIATNGQGTWIAVWITDHPGYVYDLFYSRSTDEGKTWSPSTYLSPFVNQSDFYFYDDHPDIIYSNGSFVVVWKFGNASMGPLQDSVDILASTSFDNGITWSTPRFVNSDYNSEVAIEEFLPRIATSGDGNFVVVYSTQSTIRVTYSNDFGMNWASYYTLATNLDFPVSDEYTIVYGDRLYLVVWPSPLVGSSNSLLISRSSDKGRTWTAPSSIDLDLEPTFKAHPKLYYDGITVGLAFECIKPDGFDFLNTRAITTFSDDNGTTWTETRDMNGVDPLTTASHDETPVLGYDGTGAWIGFFRRGESDEMMFTTKNETGWGIPVSVTDSIRYDGYGNANPHFVYSSSTHALLSLILYVETKSNSLYIIIRCWNRNPHLEL